MAYKTQEELLASDRHSLRFPERVWADPGGGFQHSSWYGGVQYVRDDIYAEAQATIARQQVMLDRALEDACEKMVETARLNALVAQEAEFLGIVQAKKDEYMMALASIRDNTCCEGCREAARVAGAALSSQGTARPE